MGLAYIHRQNILHRDVKSLNYFLDDRDNVLLGDMGIAKVLSNKTKFAHTFVGTPYYISPELARDKPYNKKSDVWALGVVLYELCTGRYPFDAHNEGALIRKIMKGAYQPLPQNKFSSALDSLLADMLTVDYRRRPECDDILRHSIVQSKAKQLGIPLDPALPRDSDAAATRMPREVGKTSESIGEQVGGAGAGGKAGESERNGTGDDAKSRVDEGTQVVLPGPVEGADEAKETNSPERNEQAQAREEKLHSAKGKDGGSESGRSSSKQRLGRESEERGKALKRTGPFARDDEVPGWETPFRSSTKDQQFAAANASYQAPQFGRRRNPDLMMAGPSPRDTTFGASRRPSSANQRPKQAEPVQLPKGPVSTTTTTTTTNVWGAGKG